MRNLKQDIVELFHEAQAMLADRASASMYRRFAWHNPPRENWVVPKLAPSGDFVCACGYSAHTRSQLFQHSRRCRKEQDG